MAEATTHARPGLNPEVDWLDAELETDPYPIFAYWRDERPIWRSRVLGGHVVTRYDDVKLVLSNSSTFVQSEFFEAALVDVFRQPTLLSMNPPDHGDMRGHITDYFRPSVLQHRMGAVVVEAVDELVSQIMSLGRFELNRDLTSPLVMQVMSRLMGTDNTAAMQDLYRACMAYLKLARTHSADPAVMDQGRRAGQELMEYLRTLRAEKVILPGGDLVSQLAPTDCDVDALLCMCGVVLLAGVETTVRGLANTVYALLTGPRQVVEALQSGEFSGVQAFEEGLRWIAPLSLKARQVALPTVIHGVELAVGDQVFVSIGAANRDPRHYSDPDEFQIGRRNMDHLAFGSARHYCIGAPLARIEGGTVIDVLLDRCAGLRLAQDQKVEFEGGPVYRSPRELWLEVGS